MSTTLIEIETVTLSDRLEKPATTPTLRRHRAGTKGKIQTEELLAAQLSPLASLHHASYYSRTRFGPAGCSATYVPLSIHMPDHVKELQAQQAIQAAQQAWWHCRCSQTTSDGSKRTICSSRGNPLLSPSTSCVNIQDELLEAIASPLSLDPVEGPISAPPSPSMSKIWKTSDSHPINLSVMIPPELLQVISAHLIQNENTLPIMFDLSPSKHLHLLLDRPRDSLNQRDIPSAHVRSITLASSRSSNTSRSSDLVSVLWKQTFARKKSKSELSLNTVPKQAKVRSDPVLGTARRPSFDIRPIRRRSSQSKHDTNTAVARKTPESIVIGNLFLSSCPGKKVRLDGPVNGRSAVRRDLAQDLMRMRGAGVRCVVCCLDDAELEFLGAPWPEYCRIANEIGLDILRLPVPEGLAPLDPSTFDAHLTRLITTYTLNGHHTLVHCRGGVGRAGLIACCWILKLGLCGWVDTDPCSNAYVDEPELGLRRDTLLLVERALSVVRRRRSPKAVETYEQVKFMVDYVEFLRKGGNGGGSASINGGSLDGELDVKLGASMLENSRPAWNLKVE
ncbi:unnamed protein product [Somion occarium]|uniref:Tyrosine specific protein phosphatases domain-containing protein n=1 Tax=Somion occarium TaxID=3059160 RepID=A0ABP1DJG3_9APHY